MLGVVMAQLLKGRLAIVDLEAAGSGQWPASPFPPHSRGLLTIVPLLRILLYVCLYTYAYLEKVLTFYQRGITTGCLRLWWWTLCVTKNTEWPRSERKWELCIDPNPSTL